MEWIETFGKTLEEAKANALDKLGTSEGEVEFEIVQLPTKGLFGKFKNEARVKARILPKPVLKNSTKKPQRRVQRARKDSNMAVNKGMTNSSSQQSPEPAEKKSDIVNATNMTNKANQNHPDKNSISPEPDQQAEVIVDFLKNIIDIFNMHDVSVATTDVTVDAIHVSVSGGKELGLLIGKHGETINAIQELCRRVLQQRFVNQALPAHIDIGNYKARRKEALIKFTSQTAMEAVTTGIEQVLEPMSSFERKIVHDAANSIDGIETKSEGVEPARYVVIVPVNKPGDTASKHS